MRILRLDQEYYSLADDPAVCAGAVVELIRADMVVRGQEFEERKKRWEYLARGMEEELSRVAERIFERMVRDTFWTGVDRTV